MRERGACMLWRKVKEGLRDMGWKMRGLLGWLWRGGLVDVHVGDGEVGLVCALGRSAPSGPVHGTLSVQKAEAIVHANGGGMRGGGKGEADGSVHGAGRVERSIVAERERANVKGGATYVMCSGGWSWRECVWNWEGCRKEWRELRIVGMVVRRVGSARFGCDASGCLVERMVECDWDVVWQGGGSGGSARCRSGHDAEGETVESGIGEQPVRAREPGVIVCRCSGEAGGVGESSEGAGGVGPREPEEASAVAVVVAAGGVVGELSTSDDGTGKASEPESAREHLRSREGGGERGRGCGRRGEGWGRLEWDSRREVDLLGRRRGIELDEASSGWAVGRSEQGTGRAGAGFVGFGGVGGGGGEEQGEESEGRRGGWGAERERGEGKVGERGGDDEEGGGVSSGGERRRGRGETARSNREGERGAAGGGGEHSGGEGGGVGRECKADEEWKGCGGDEAGRVRARVVGGGTVGLSGHVRGSWMGGSRMWGWWCG